jgi:rRNA-processing protein FCF1
MAGPPKKLCAIDFNFLLLLEARRIDCVTAFETLERRKFHFILTESPLQELQDMANRTAASDFARFASDLMAKLRTGYGIQTPGLQSVYRDCATITAEVLLEKALPAETSKNAALAIVEASLHESTCLLTVDRSLCKADNGKVNAVLLSRDCNPVWIFNPEVVSLVES